MAVKLTEGAISQLSAGRWETPEVQPVLQVVDIRPIQTQFPSAGGVEKPERYRLLLSDGVLNQQGMLATQRNGLVRSQQLQKGSIVRLTEFACNSIRDRVIIIIVNLDVLVETCDVISLHPNVMAVKLTEGAISLLSTGRWENSEVHPVLQVVDIWDSCPVQTQTPPAGGVEKQERYRLLLSDGLANQQGMLATQRNDLVRSQRLQKGSIVRLTEFFCNSIRDRIIIIIINLDVLVETCDVIGDSKPSTFCPPKDPLTSSTAAPVQFQAINQPVTSISNYPLNWFNYLMECHNVLSQLRLLLSNANCFNLCKPCKLLISLVYLMKLCNLV